MQPDIFMYEKNSLNSFIFYFNYYLSLDLSKLKSYEGKTGEIFPWKRGAKSNHLLNLSRVRYDNNYKRERKLKYSAFLVIIEILLASLLANHTSY